MDNTPLHPDIITLPLDTGQRHGDFLTAIPYNRSMYRTTLLLRITSILVASIIIGLVGSVGSVGSMQYDSSLGFNNLVFGVPTAALAWLWSMGDIIAMLVRDRGLRWTKNDPTKLPRSTRFSWGSPGGHVTAHLVIWVPTLAFSVIVVLAWLNYARPSDWGPPPIRSS
ncbi:hypothetical protein ColLi_10113 [Colletotrichum liriopes]|uniref:Uncharacterized protein n=1 Tax=Colletotrichum liriopes TaxID=708192 RepID=A0AA37GU45_9PEZI|nr:hypothetical protein ColLi_10113 [Colletotrichum liriopes]